MRTEGNCMDTEISVSMDTWNNPGMPLVSIATSSWLIIF